MGYFQRSLRGCFGDDADPSNLAPDPIDPSLSLAASDSTSLPIPAPDSGLSAADQAAIESPDTSKFKSMNGVCYPQTTAGSQAVQTLQRQMNRIAAVNGFTKVSPDGYVGPATLALLTQISADLSSTNCLNVAPYAAERAAVVQSMADAMGAPSAGSSSPAPSGNAGGIVTPSGKIVQGPVQTGSILDPFNALSTPEQVGVVALGAGILYMLFTGSKKAARSSRTKRSR
jgi:hypothetical protein